MPINALCAMFCPNDVFRTFNYKQLLMVALLTMSLMFLFTIFVFTYVRALPLLLFPL